MCVLAAGFSAVVVMLSSSDLKSVGFLESNWLWRLFFSLNIEIYLWGGINLNAKFNVEIFWTSVWGAVRGIGFITSSVLLFHQFYSFNFSFEPQWISYNLLSWGLKKTKLNFWSVNLESVLTLWLDFVCLAVQCFILSMVDLPSNSLKLQRHLPKPTRETPDSA